MQDEKSQLQNRERAMRVLRARLYERALAEQQAAVAASRAAQVGTGERAEKIRTYNFPERRVTDHRIGLRLHNLDGILMGELDELTPALQDDEKRRRLEEKAVGCLRPRRASGRRSRALSGAARPRTLASDVRHSSARRRAAAGVLLGVDRARLVLDATSELEPAVARAFRRARRRGARHASRWPTSWGARTSGGSPCRWIGGC